MNQPIKIRRDKRFPADPVFLLQWGRRRRALLSMPLSNPGPPSDDACRQAFNDTSAAGDAVAGPLTAVHRMDTASARNGLI